MLCLPVLTGVPYTFGEMPFKAMKFDLNPFRGERWNRVLSTIDMKQLGVGLSTAILIDATIVRGVLLPATLRLLGDRIWSGGKQPAPAPVAEAAA